MDKELTMGVLLATAFAYLALLIAMYFTNEDKLSGRGFILVACGAVVLITAGAVIDIYNTGLIGQ